MSRCFVQIGAGAGDQDSRANFRDGFSELVKSCELGPDDKIVLVEPNPINLPALKKCWEAYPQASIHQLGIVPKADAGRKLLFYYAEEDAPHFQVASFRSDHVLKHYPHLGEADLKTQEIGTTDLASLLAEAAGGDLVALLCLDIEGLDAEVLLDTDLASLNVAFISFEHLHLGEKTEAVVSHFEKSGYVKAGAGLDPYGFDWLYKKECLA